MKDALQGKSREQLARALKGRTHAALIDIIFSLAEDRLREKMKPARLSPAGAKARAAIAKAEGNVS